MMTKVFYFSGTGNSLYAAKKIVEGIADAELVAMTDAIAAKRAVPCDKAVLVFPVYLWGLPHIVSSFLETMAFADTTSIYAIATFGGLAGDPYKYARRILAIKGDMLSAGYLVWMPENFIYRYPPFPKWLEKISLRTADKKIQRIIANIEANQTGRYERSGYGINWFLSIQGEYLSNQLFGIKKIRPKDYFWANDTCSKCGLCVRICPMKNISWNEGSLSWGDNCELCVSCLQWCPQEAIQMKKATLHRKRYHHPGITIGEFLAR